jgi:hypothetical protein
MRNLLISVLAFLLPVSCLAQQSRHFTFHYAFTVHNVPQGQKVEILVFSLLTNWFPSPAGWPI